MARAIETVVWESPFVAPSERLLGAELVTYMNMQPIWRAGLVSAAAAATPAWKIRRELPTISHVHPRHQGHHYADQDPHQPINTIGLGDHAYNRNQRKRRGKYRDSRNEDTSGPKKPNDFRKE